jgi:predicted nucleic acid-binding protein
LPQDVNLYQFKRKQKFLPDTNSLLLAHGMGGSPNRVEAYRSIEKKIRAGKGRFYICWVILLEFVRALVKVHWDEAKTDEIIPMKCKLKEFRESPQFELVRAKILEIVGSILEEYIYIEDDERKKFDLIALFDDIDDFSIDIHDVAIARLCLKYNLTLVTDDRDFLAVNKALAERGVHPRDQLSILTANQRMLENKAEDDAN